MSPSPVIDGLRDLAGRLARADRFDLALRLTLLDLLLQPVGEPGIRFVLLTGSGLGLLFPRLLRSPPLWWGATILLAVRVVGDWPLADNHSYLLCYWCGAIALSLSSEAPDEFLAHNGRWLIGLVFLFATLWKVALSPDFVSGVAFRVTLILDPRFEDFTRLAAGVSPDWIEAQRVLLGQHADGAQSLGAASGSAEWARVGRIARAGTFWTLGLEALVALAFLWPPGRGLPKARDAALQVFCATTYAVATVAGFGWLLVAMGVAQSDRPQGRARALYLAVFVLILFSREIPWLALIADSSAAR